MNGPSRHALRLALALAVLWPGGCDLGPRVLLAIDLQTDIAPILEFDAVRVTAQGSSDGRDVEPGESFLEGRRVAELRVSPGTVRVSVELLGSRGRVRAERTMIVDMRGDTVIVVPISGLCRGVVCEPDQTCIRGNCLDPASACGGEPCDAQTQCADGVCSPECEADEDCEPLDSCSTPRCYDRVCVGIPDPGACPISLYCSVGLGCRSFPSGVDAGMGLDASLPDGAVPPGEDGGATADAGTCGSCTTICGTMGQLACDAGGQPTTTCIPPDEICNGANDDCDGAVDEGLGCDHTHDVLFMVGTAGMTALADRVTPSSPGVVCAGTACGSTLSSWRTLPGPDGHTHTVGGQITFGTSSSTFSPPGGTGSAGDHTHGIGCSQPGARGSYFYDLEDPDDATRYNRFCMGPSGPCGSTFGGCTAR